MNPLGAPNILHVEGCDLHYWLVGPEGASVVVCTAGATADRRLFLPQIPALSQRHRLLLWDVRGNGLSQPAGEPPTAQRATTDLAILLDRLGLDRIALVGQSFGGMVGQELIFRQPERVVAAVMLGTTCLTMPLSWSDRLGLALTPLITRLYPKPLFRRQGPRNVAITEPARRAYRQMIDDLSPAAINTIYTGLAHSMHPEPGYRIEIPLLICHGDQDRVGNIRRTAQRWLAREPRAEFALIPDAGHHANMDNPSFFNALVLEFLKRFLPRNSR